MASAERPAPERGPGPVRTGAGGRVAEHPAVQSLEPPERRAAVVALAEALYAPAPDGGAEREDGEGLFDSPSALIRYLRARKWQLDAAEAMIRATARWRREFGHAGIRHGAPGEDLRAQNATGKLYVRGFDRQGRPTLYIKTRHETSEDPPSIVRHLVYNVERAVACLERLEREGGGPCGAGAAGGGKFVLLVDFSNYSLKNMIPMPVAKEAILILQDHYPERLGAAFLIEAPWMMSGLFSALTPFLDPVTVDKFQFVTESGAERRARMERFFDLAVLEPEFGGTAHAPFDSCTYLTAPAPGVDVFGLEFNEQAQLRSTQGGTCLAVPAPAWTAPAATPAQSSRRPSAPAPPPPAAPCVQPRCREAYWVMCSDMRVLALGRRERAAVRSLARSLAAAEGDAEEPAGLFDDAGALIRYLAASGWDLGAAEARIRASARWRKDFGFAAQRAGAFDEAIARESAAGSMYVRGYDRRGRPLLILRLGRRGATWSMRHLVYCVERAVACLDRREAEARARCSSYGEAEAESRAAGGRLTLLVDFGGYSSRSRPPLQLILEAARVLQDHYPERLGSAYLLHPPVKVSALWKAVRRTLAPETSEKIVMVTGPSCHEELLTTTLDRKTLERSLGGENDAPFDSQIFVSEGVCGSVYGTEFDEQLAVRGGAARGAPPPRPAPGPGAEACAGRQGSHGLLFDTTSSIPSEPSEQPSASLDGLLGGRAAPR